MSRMPSLGNNTCEHWIECMDIKLRGVYLQRATALVLKHPFMLLSTACSPWSSVTRSMFCWRQHLPVTLCFMHRWLFTILGVISPPHSGVTRTLSPPCPLLFSFKTKQKPKQGIQRMFFLPTKEISGTSSKPLVSALGLAAMCSISHQLSPITGKCAPTSWAAAGEQLGWAMLGWDSETEQRAKEGFCITGRFFLDAYRRWTSWLCVPFPARTQFVGRVVAPTPCTPEQRGLGRNPALVSAARRQGITLPGVMPWHVVEEALAVILLAWCFPDPLSLKVITGNKLFFVCVSHWHFPAFPTATSWMLVWFSHTVFRNGCVKSPDCHHISGLSLCGPDAPPASSFLGQPESPWERHTESQLKWSRAVSEPLTCLIYLWKNKFLLFPQENSVFLHEI